MKRLWDENKGIAFISTFVFMLTMALMVSAFLDISSTETRDLKGRMDFENAFWYAETGLHKAIWYLITPPSQGGKGPNYQTSSDGLTESFEDGKYNIVIAKSKSDGTRTITSKGIYQNLSRKAQQRFAVKSGLFTFAAFGGSSVTMSDSSKIDSYDSRNGSYDASKAGSDGDIGTNKISKGVISLKNKARVKGDAVVGPKANVTTAIQVSGSAVVEGSKLSAPREKGLKEVVIPSGIPNSGNLVVRNRTVKLTKTTYLYNSISIQTGGLVQFTKKSVTVYVKGNVTIQGKGIEALDKLPTNLFILIKGNRSINMSSSPKVYGAVYAPTSTITLSDSAQLFGSIAGKTITIKKTSQVHFDEALADPASASSAEDVRVESVKDSWTEIRGS